MIDPRLRIGPDRQSLGRSPNDHLRGSPHRSTGATLFVPLYLSYLARAYAELGQFDDAWRCIGEAMTAVETTKERWCEAEIHRIAGEIALMSPEPDAAKAEAYFERALAVAREQQAKSWELRAAMSMARLWRDQGKRQQARDFSLRSTAGSPKVRHTRFKAVQGFARRADMTSPRCLVLARSCRSPRSKLRPLLRYSGREMLAVRLSHFDPLRS